MRNHNAPRYIPFAQETPKGLVWGIRGPDGDLPERYPTIQEAYDNLEVLELYDELTK